MGAAKETAGHAFISYVREDAAKVDQLQVELEAAGIHVWRDTGKLWPGQDWKAQIRKAITDDTLVFIACFSRRGVEKPKSYQREELLLAIGEWRQRPRNVTWLIPVRFDDCEVPDYPLDVSLTLNSLQRADLFGEGRQRAVSMLITSVKGRLPPGQAVPAPAAPAAAAARKRVQDRPASARTPSPVIRGGSGAPATVGDAVVRRITADLRAGRRVIADLLLIRCIIDALAAHELGAACSSALAHAFMIDRYRKAHFTPDLFDSRFAWGLPQAHRALATSGEDAARQSTISLLAVDLPLALLLRLPPAISDRSGKQRADELTWAVDRAIDRHYGFRKPDTGAFARDLETIYGGPDIPRLDPAHVMGAAISGALAGYIERFHSVGHSWSDNVMLVVTNEFLRVTDAASCARPIPLEEIHTHMVSALAAFRRRVAESHQPATWALTVADRLEAAGEPQLLTCEPTGALRLATLSLAAEADPYDAGIGTAFRRIVAGLTVACP